ncbi:MAG: hypothetical protein R2742_04310 [Micropruina glycogenica]
MLAAQVVYTLGVVFAYWLFFQAYFVIGALCPWCLLVTLSAALVCSSLTHVNIRDGNLLLPERASQAARTLIAHDLDALLVGVVDGRHRDGGGEVRTPDAVAAHVAWCRHLVVVMKATIASVRVWSTSHATFWLK